MNNYLEPRGMQSQRKKKKHERYPMEREIINNLKIEKQMSIKEKKGQ